VEVDGGGFAGPVHGQERDASTTADSIHGAPAGVGLGPGQVNLHGDDALGVQEADALVGVQDLLLDDVAVGTPLGGEVNDDDLLGRGGLLDVGEDGIVGF